MGFGFQATDENMLEARNTGLLHPLIDKDRNTGNGYYVSCRHYEQSGDLEISGIKLAYGDQLRKGGGAKRHNSEKSEMDEVTLQKSLSRARTKIRRLAMAMCCDRMLTLTFRENLTDLDQARRVFKYFNKLMAQAYGDDWRYICVPEKQQRGAIHFHLAIAGFKNVRLVRTLWRRAAGKYQGNIDITSPKTAGKNSWNPRRVANYISKYISKTDAVGFNKRRYSTGGKIQIPDPIRGWLALGVPVIQIFQQVIESRTDKLLSYTWESDQNGGIIYCTT